MTRERIHGRNVYTVKQRPSNIRNLFEQTVKKYPTREVIVYDEERITYIELQKQVHTLADYLQTNCSLRKGDRLALLLGNRPEFIQTFLACAYLGIIVVPLNIRSSEEELKSMLNKSGAKMICGEKIFENFIQQWKAENPKARVLLTDKSDHDYDEMADILKKESSAPSYPEIEEEDPFYIMFTSGTTGDPKGAVGSHVNVIHSALHYREVFQAKEPVRTLIAVPLFHVTGLIGQLFYMLLIGGTNVLMKKYQTGPFLEQIDKERITFLFNVPTIYIMMMSHEKFDSTDMTSLDIAAFGGAPMSQGTIESLMKALPDLSLHNAYGATETTSPATIMPKMKGYSKMASIGQPVPTGELKVVNEYGEEVAPGDVGELYIKGPMIVQGYWENDEANMTSFDQGYWKSGDMAVMDEEGFFYMMDRKKDMINRGGEKVFSADVENVLYGHPDVLEAAIIGVPDSIFGERVKAFIVPRDGAEPSASDIKNYMKEQMADYKVPEYVEIIRSLPRNPGGKILKNQLVNAEEKK
ncbi:class I adenylate-forming enzyme family protein [Halobacillus trueperi]|uniref:Long-chain fatty acid--CoA ligase n=1 Tax=Halobacillus trueperi TaxID=156205 RepID=A0A3E0J7T9_9BACI|nr:class I adenylate-forming enzyme family protein [Halobacillus trueperi]REJ09016.1 long-chain fatty acid--CoA ligase [Halobacillus trueperi]